MFNQDTEVLFPSRVIPSLRALQGEEWRKIIDRVRSDESTQVERFAFTLMMARMCGCAGCNADSFRAMRGCTQCARQTVRRYRGSDSELNEQFAALQREVESHMAKTNLSIQGDEQND